MPKRVDPRQLIKTSGPEAIDTLKWTFEDEVKWNTSLVRCGSAIRQIVGLQDHLLKAYDNTFLEIVNFNLAANAAQSIIDAFVRGGKGAVQAAVKTIISSALDAGAQERLRQSIAKATRMVALAVQEQILKQEANPARPVLEARKRIRGYTWKQWKAGTF